MVMKVSEGKDAGVWRSARPPLKVEVNMGGRGIPLYTSGVERKVSIARGEKNAVQRGWVGWGSRASHRARYGVLRQVQSKATITDEAMLEASQEST